MGPRTERKTLNVKMREKERNRTGNVYLVNMNNDLQMDIWGREKNTCCVEMRTVRKPCKYTAIHVYSANTMYRKKEAEEENNSRERRDRGEHIHRTHIESYNQCGFCRFSGESLLSPLFLFPLDQINFRFITFILHYGRKTQTGNRQIFARRNRIARKKHINYTNVSKIKKIAYINIIWPFCLLS